MIQRRDYALRETATRKSFVFKIDCCPVLLFPEASALLVLFSMIDLPANSLVEPIRGHSWSETKYNADANEEAEQSHLLRKRHMRCSYKTRVLPLLIAKCT